MGDRRVRFEDKVREVARNVTASGIDVAGTAVMGPLWPVVKAAVEPLVTRLLDTPNARLEAITKEWEAEHKKHAEMRELAQTLIEALDERHFELLRQNAEVLSHVASATAFRVSRVREQMRGAYFLGQALDAFFAGEGDAYASVESSLALLGLPEPAMAFLRRRFAALPGASKKYEAASALTAEISTALELQVHPVVRFAFQLGTMRRASGREVVENRDRLLSAAQDTGVPGIVAEVDRTLRRAAEANGKERDEIIQSLFGEVALAL